MRRTLAVVSSAAALLVLAGCGGARPSTTSVRGSASVPVINVTADPSGDYDFLPRSLGARPGKLTIELYNPLSTFGPHGIAIEGHGVHAAGPAARRGGVSTVTVTLAPGRYELYSPVDGDRGNGMTAPLIVRAAAQHRRIG